MHTDTFITLADVARGKSTVKMKKRLPLVGFLVIRKVKVILYPEST